MNRLDYLYVLVHSAGDFFKVGVSSSLDKRLKTLMQVFGPFDTEKSFLVRMDSAQDAKALEEGVKRLFSSYRFTMPRIGNNRNGETEWYLIDCFADMSDWVQDFARRKGEVVRRMHLPWMLDVGDCDQSLSDRRAELLLQHAPKLEALRENAAGEKRIRDFLRAASDFLIGVAEVGTEDRRGYEIYMSPDYSDFDEMRDLLSVDLTAEDEDFSAWARVCTGVDATKDYKRLHLSVPEMHVDGRSSFGGQWEAERFVKSYSAMLTGLAQLYPLPPAFQKFVGKSFWDDFSDDEKRDVANKMWEALFGGPRFP